MKRKPTPKKAPRQAKGKGTPPAKAKQLLDKGTSKKRATISASQPHSKTFGH